MFSRVRRAFTLIELLVVVSIISILTMIAMPNFTLALTRAKAARAHNDMRVVAGGLEIYMVDHSTYPEFLYLAEKTRYFANVTDIFSKGSFWYETPKTLWGLPEIDRQLKTSYTQEIGHSWLLGSVGPDKTWFNLTEFQDTRYSLTAPYRDYDATNGTLSAGNLFRTSKNPERLAPPPGLYEDAFGEIETE